jgi:ribosomal protein S18 acetylase RimI-like enzyme
VRRATVRAVFPWEHVAKDYPRRGRPGVVEFAPSVDIVILCLLWYDDHGKLRGIFNYYPDGTKVDRAGDCNVIVHPQWRRRGIATELMDEAYKRWPINLDQQTFTSEGLAFVTAYEEDR